MKKKRFFLVLVIAFAFGLNSSGQQIGLNTLYNQNNYLVNPAAAGLANCFSAYLNHRNQWVGINNSPVRNALTLDGRIAGAHGIGLDTRMYSAGLLNDFNVKLTYAYHLKMAEKANLSFGLSLGLIQQSFAFSDAIATDYSDNALTGGNQSDIGFTSDAGLLFSTPRLTLGVAIPQVFSRGLATDLNGISSEFKLVQHVVFHGAYDLIRSDKWSVSPSVLYKNASFIGHQFDLGLRAAWKNTLGAGVIYRTSYGVIGMVDLTVKDRFKLAYGYGFGGGSLKGLTSGSHEIMLGIKLCRNERPIVDELVDEMLIDTVSQRTEPPIETIVEQTVEVVDTVQEVKIINEPVLLDLDSLNQAYRLSDKLILYQLNSAADVTSANQSKVISEVVQLLTDHPDLNVEIIGHTCDIGSDEYNKEIGRQRAEDIKAALVKSGISPNRIKVVSKGESQPFLPNTSDENREKNRRVQLVFVKK